MDPAPVSYESDNIRFAGHNNFPGKEKLTMIFPAIDLESTFRQSLGHPAPPRHPPIDLGGKREMIS
jgi:hypothetical protein